MDAGEEQQQRRQHWVACRLWALFVVLAGAVERTAGPVAGGFVVVVVAVETYQLTVRFAAIEYW